MEQSLRERKPLRLKEFDYRSNGCYFITICTQNRIEWFWDAQFIVGATIGRPPVPASADPCGLQCGQPPLSDYGRIVESAILKIPLSYSNVSIETFVIMPNHIHLLLILDSSLNDGRPMVAPTISQIIQQFKGIVTKQIGFSIWQKSFRDHIIRDKQDFLRIWTYIAANPRKWEEDCYYRG